MATVEAAPTYWDRQQNAKTAPQLDSGVAEREDCTTTRLGGNAEPSSGADRLAAETIDRNPS
jgi:hypothetical protein